MFNKENLIFVVDDDKAFGNLVVKKLQVNGYNNTHFFSNENLFLDCMIQHPSVVICDYELEKTNGLQLIAKAKKLHSFFYSILLSGAFHENKDNCYDPRFLHLIDRYLIKGLNEINELMYTLEEEVCQ